MELIESIKEKTKLLQSKHPLSYFYLIMTLSDGFEISFNKWSTRSKIIIDPYSKKNSIKMKKKFFLKKMNNKKIECNYFLKIKLHNSKFIKTNNLEDLKIFLSIKSKQKHCSIDLVSQFTYNTFERLIKSKHYLSYFLSIAIFDLILVIYVVMQLENSYFLANSQSVLFWTINASFSCLLCFLNVFFSVDNFNNLIYFMILASLHFFNFSLLILRLLYIIGRHKLFTLIQNDPTMVFY